MAPFVVELTVSLTSNRALGADDSGSLQSYLSSYAPEIIRERTEEHYEKFENLCPLNRHEDLLRILSRPYTTPAVINKTGQIEQKAVTRGTIPPLELTELFETWRMKDVCTECKRGIPEGGALLCDACLTARFCRKKCKDDGMDRHKNACESAHAQPR